MAGLDPAIHELIGRPKGRPSYKRFMASSFRKWLIPNSITTFQKPIWSTSAIPMAAFGYTTNGTGDHFQAAQKPHHHEPHRRGQSLVVAAEPAAAFDDHSFSDSEMPRDGGN